MLRLYNTLLWPLGPAAELWARMPGPAVSAERDERRGLGLPELPPGGVWIHGASLGETRLVVVLARALRAALGTVPLAVSALTRTGRSHLPLPPAVDAACFAPLDLPRFVRRSLAALRPRVLALVETELWPNLLAEAVLAGASVVVLNGRLSERGMTRYARLGRLYRPLLGRLSHVGAQSADDAERFVALGAPRRIVSVTGNLKYDLAPPPGDAAALRRRLDLRPERPAFVAGSTAAGEEGPVLAAFDRLRTGHPELLLVLAPRHPERFDDVEREIVGRGLSVVRLSRGRSAARADVLLVDTVGDLAGLWRLAVAAFVGGSLVPVGGHNLLEPAAVGAPVLFGPHTTNVAEPAAALIAAGGGRCVDGAERLAAEVAHLLEDRAARAAMGRAAAGVVEANRGALARSVALVEQALGRNGRRLVVS